ncbi:MAG: hypothetical protein AAGJ35_13030, partial [Myxococcota bacterium]
MIGRNRDSGRARDAFVSPDFDKLRKDPSVRWSRALCTARLELPCPGSFQLELVTRAFAETET